MGKKHGYIHIHSADSLGRRLCNMTGIKDKDDAHMHNLNE